MKTIAWQTTGEGNCHLVLLHGWGLNAKVWDCITPQLASHFTLHLVDLPGYGRSSGFGALSLEEMAQQVLEPGPGAALSGWAGASAGWWPVRLPYQHPGSRTGAGHRGVLTLFWRSMADWPGIKARGAKWLSAAVERRFPAYRGAVSGAANAGDGKRSPGCPRALKSTVLSLPMPSRRSVERRTGDP